MRRVIIAAAVLLFGVQAHAGTITQTVGFDTREHGGFGLLPYNQLDPSLAPLNDVATTVNFVGVSGNLYYLVNPTSTTITFDATLNWLLVIDGGTSASNRFTVNATLGPSQFTTLQFSLFGFQLSSVQSSQTTNLSGYIGTGQLYPFGSPTSGGFVGYFERVTVDNSSIMVTTMYDQQPVSTSAMIGTETVTYYFGPTVIMPEPASLVMLSIGLATVAGVAGLAWQHRSRAKFAA
jgi:hypothetical protein